MDRQLLALKAAENASTLSKRNEELDKATEQISHTKSQLRKLAFYDSVTIPSFVTDSTDDPVYEVVKVPYPADLPNGQKARFGRIKVAVTP